MDGSTSTASAAAMEIERAILKVLEERRRQVAEGRKAHGEGMFSVPSTDSHDRNLREVTAKDAAGDETMQGVEDVGEVTKGKIKEFEDTWMKGLEGSTSGPPKPKSLPSAKTLAKYREMGKQLVEEGLKADNSYSLDLVTVEQQAAKEPDFIGTDVSWYDLTKDGARQHVDGEYLIVWTCNTGNVEEGQKEVELFDISMANRLNIYSNKREHADDKTLSDIFDAGYFGAIKFRAGGKTLDMAIARDEEGDCVAGIYIFERSVDQKPCTSFLQQVICTRIRPKGSMAVFGIKTVGNMKNMNDAGHFTTVTLGFEFVKIFLSQTNPLTKEPDILEVVAIKIPKAGNVASAFILKQKLFDLPNPAWVVQREEEVEEGAVQEDEHADVEMLV